MVEYISFELSFEHCMNENIKLSSIIESLYDAIPSHEIYDILNIDDTKFMISYYAVLYQKISKYHALCMLEYQARMHNRAYYLKNAFEQALKVLKLQYEALSRRITIEKNENYAWGGVHGLQ